MPPRNKHTQTPAIVYVSTFYNNSYRQTNTNINRLSFLQKICSRTFRGTSCKGVVAMPRYKPPEPTPPSIPHDLRYLDERTSLEVRPLLISRRCTILDPTVRGIIPLSYGKATSQMLSQHKTEHTTNTYAAFRLTMHDIIPPFYGRFARNRIHRGQINITTL